MRSMTAFGRNSQSLSLGRWIAEIHSVNRKQLDLSVYMPKDFLVFDVDVRKKISSVVFRGQITLKIFFSEQMDSSISYDQKLLRLERAKSFYQKLSHELGVDSSSLQNLPFLLDHENEFSLLNESSDEAALKEELFFVLDQALDQFLRMKEVEGLSLGLEMSKNLEMLKDYLDQIETIAPEQTERYKLRLAEKLKQIVSGDLALDERYLKEVMLFAEKVDIAEEITRLKSHIDQLRTLFQSKDKTLGKNIDFLLQEVNREINTICSKSESLDVSYLALQMRAELEKIREQAQNIE
jgi:uncharacterized protein (TIGR00255 family)